jgi:hypothetical protein
MCMYVCVYVYVCVGVCVCIYEGQDNVVGIVTRYGLDGPGIKSRWGEIFRTHPY